jgi:hypothetical protein
LTAAAVVAAAILSRQYLQGVFGLLLSLYIMVKIVFDLDKGGVYADHLGYVQDVASGDPLTMVFTLVNFMILGYVVTRKLHLFAKPWFGITFFLLFAYSIKIVWMNSGNHVSYLFFMQLLLLAMINSEKFDDPFLRFINLIVFIGYSSCVLWLCLNHASFSVKLPYLNYNKPYFSRIFKVESTLNEKLNVFGRDYRPQDFVISPNDAALGISVEKQLTATADLGSFTQKPMNLPIAIVSLPKSGRVAIDKSIMHHNAWSYPISPLDSFLVRSKALGVLANEIQNSPGFILCHENDYFIYYCSQ